MVEGGLGGGPPPEETKYSPDYEALFKERTEHEVERKRLVEAFTKDNFTEELPEIEIGSAQEVELYVDSVLGEALDAKYGKEGESYRAYHERRHSQLVEESLLECIDAGEKVCPELVLGMSREDFEALSPVEQEKKLVVQRAYAKALAWGHDFVQEADVDPETGKLVRYRGMEGDFDTPEGNEAKSAVALRKFLRSFKYLDGSGVFDDISDEQIWADVAATLPDFDFGPGGKGVYQPGLTAETSFAGVSLAMGDLRGAESRGFDWAAEGSDAEFREVNVWITEGIEKGFENLEYTNLKGKSEQELKDEAVVAALSWLKNASSFDRSQGERSAEFINDMVSDERAKELFARRFMKLDVVREGEVQEGGVSFYEPKIPDVARSLADVHEGGLAQMPEEFIPPGFEILRERFGDSGKESSSEELGSPFVEGVQSIYETNAALSDRRFDIIRGRVAFLKNMGKHDEAFNYIMGEMEFMDRMSEEELAEHMS